MGVEKEGWKAGLGFWRLRRPVYFIFSLLSLSITLEADRIVPSWRCQLFMMTIVTMVILIMIIKLRLNIEPPLSMYQVLHK